MRFADYTKHLIGLGQTIYQWAGQIAEVDRARREKVALYAEEIAATLNRAANALAALEAAPADRAVLLAATRELGRISGYVETIMSALQHHLDGRKRAGVKRRLEYLEPFELEAAIAEHGAFRQARRLAAAGGYFRALADALRA
ncbi:MAG: hypothetical protein ABL897_11250 [Hyphomicrobium sp.]